MNKIKQRLLDNLPTLFVVLTFLFGMTLIFNHAKAEHGHQDGKPLYLDLQVRSVPLYCGETAYVFQTAFEIFGEKLIAGAKVKKQGVAEAPTLGVSQYTIYDIGHKKVDMLSSKIKEINDEAEVVCEDRMFQNYVYMNDDDIIVLGFDSMKSRLDAVKALTKWKYSKPYLKASFFSRRSSRCARGCSRLRR